MFYRQSIALFGIVLPLILAIAVVGGAFYLKSTMDESFATKQKAYKVYDQTRIGALGVETQVRNRRVYVDQWKAQLSEETKSALSSNLRKIQETLPGKEFQTTVTETLNTRAGFASASAQKSSQIHLGFRGTFRTVQRAFLELETRMPQLQLQEFKMDPNTTGPVSLLNFDVTYTAWEN